MNCSNCKEVISGILGSTGGKHGNFVANINLRSGEFTPCSSMHEGCFVKQGHSTRNLAKYSLSLSAGRHFWLVQPHEFCILTIDLAIVFSLKKTKDIMLPYAVCLKTDGFLWCNKPIFVKLIWFSIGSCLHIGKDALYIESKIFSFIYFVYR